MQRELSTIDSITVSRLDDLGVRLDLEMGTASLNNKLSVLVTADGPRGPHSNT